MNEAKVSLEAIPGDGEVYIHPIDVTSYESINTLISDVIKEYDIDFDVSFTNFNTNKEEVKDILFNEKFAVVSDITDGFPILRKKDRDLKRRLSYVTMTLTLAAAVIIKNTVISNLLIFLTIFQTLWISRFIYKLTNNKYGYEEYIKEQNASNMA